MNAEERDLIRNLFDRIGAARAGGNDPEADRLIGELVARNSNAPYVLVQTVLLQEEALRRAEQRIRQLEGASGGSTRDQAARSFLRQGVLGEQPRGAGSVPAVDPRRQESDLGSRGGERGPQGQAYGGSFLGNALSTASGVAGGVLLADSIRSLFGGGQADAKASPAEDAASPSHTTGEKAAETKPEPAAEAPAHGPEDASQEDDFGFDEGWSDDWGDDGSFDV